MKKRLLSMVLAAAMTVCCLVGCGTPNETQGNGGSTQQNAPQQEASGGDEQTPGTEPRLVGVAVLDQNAGDAKYVDYLSNEVGPALNLTFDFSEAITDTEELVTFIENEKSKGAVGIINEQPDGAEQATALCEEYGMWIVNIESDMKDSVKDIPHNAGSIGGAVAGIADVYKEGMGHILSDGESHSVIIFSGAASYGAQTHVYTAMAALEAMQEAYGLTYDKDIRELAASSEVGEISTGRDDIKVYMVPGTDVGTAGQTVSTQLQTGNYDIFVAVFAYAAFTGYISEVENALGTDVKILATTPLKDETTKGFTTEDAFGNSTLNAAIINPVYENAGYAAFLIYMGLEGKIDSVKDNGSAVQYYINQWLCEDIDTYNSALKLNDGAGTYSLSGQDLLDLSNDVSVDSLRTHIDSMKDIKGILERLNLQ